MAVTPNPASLGYVRNTVPIIALLVPGVPTTLPQQFLQRLRPILRRTLYERRLFQGCKDFSKLIRIFDPAERIDPILVFWPHMACLRRFKIPSRKQCDFSGLQLTFKDGDRAGRLRSASNTPSASPTTLAKGLSKPCSIPIALVNRPSDFCPCTLFV